MNLILRDVQMIRLGRRLGHTEREIAEDIRAVYLPQVVGLVEIFEAMKKVS